MTLKLQNTGGEEKRGDAAGQLAAYAIAPAYQFCTFLRRETFHQVNGFPASLIVILEEFSVLLKG